MAMEKLIAGLTADLEEFRAKMAKIYACTCDWSQYDNAHADNCPQEIRLRDGEAVRD